MLLRFCRPSFAFVWNDGALCVWRASSNKLPKRARAYVRLLNRNIIIFHVSFNHQQHDDPHWALSLCVERIICTSRHLASVPFGNNFQIIMCTVQCHCIRQSGWHRTYYYYYYNECRDVFFSILHCSFGILWRPLANKSMERLSHQHASSMWPNLVARSDNRLSSDAVYFVLLFQISDHNDRPERFEIQNVLLGALFVCLCFSAVFCSAQMVYQQCCCCCCCCSTVCALHWMEYVKMVLYRICRKRQPQTIARRTQRKRAHIDVCRFAQIAPAKRSLVQYVRPFDVHGTIRSRRRRRRSERSNSTRPGHIVFRYQAHTMRAWQTFVTQHWCWCARARVALRSQWFLANRRGRLAVLPFCA